MSWGIYRKVQNFFRSNRTKFRKIHIHKDGDESVVTISYKRNLLIVLDLWQLHYQFLLTISQKKFTKLNAKVVIVLLIRKVSRKIK